MTEEKHEINMKDKYCTREHYEKCIAEDKKVTPNVEILKTDLKNDKYSVVAVLDNYIVRQYTKDGYNFNFDKSKYNLIKIPTKKAGWMNVYKYEKTVHSDKEIADIGAKKNRIKCVQVWWYE